MNIVLCGAPGSGKDTLAKKLSVYGYKILTTGELYRNEAAAGTEFGLLAKSYWDKGNLCPDDMTNELMKRTLDNIKDRRDLVFNGFPRTLQQAEFLNNIIGVDICIDLHIPDDVVLSRLLARHRQDDTEEVIKQRLKVYHENNTGIVDYYRKMNCYTTINSTKSPEAVFNEAVNIILNVKNKYE